MVGTCPVVVAQMGGVDVMCLVDSGSEVTTVTESFYRKYLQKPLSDLHGWVSLKAANGIEIPCVGLLEINLALDNTHYDQVCVFVVKDPLDKSTKDRKLKVPGVIGCNVLQKMFKDGKGMDFLRNSSQRRPGLTDELMAFKSKQVWSERIKAKISTTGSGKIGAVKVLCKGNPVSIPARTLSLVMGTTPHLPDGSEVLIETADIASVPEGLMVCPTLTKVYNNTVKFQVLNLSSMSNSYSLLYVLLKLV